MSKKNDIRYHQIKKNFLESAEGHWISAACPSGKRTYVNRAAAKAAAKLQAKRGFGNMRPYECPKCGGNWHIGHQRIR